MLGQKKSIASNKVKKAEKAAERNYFFQKELDITLSDMEVWDDLVTINLVECKMLTLRDCYFAKGLVITGKVDTLICENVRGDVINSTLICETLVISATKDFRPCLTFKESYLENVKSVIMNGGVNVTYQNPYKPFEVKGTLKIDHSTFIIDCSFVNCYTLTIADSELGFNNFDKNFEYCSLKETLECDLAGLNFKECTTSSKVNVSFFGDNACIINGKRYSDITTIDLREISDSL